MTLALEHCCSRVLYCDIYIKNLKLYKILVLPFFYLLTFYTGSYTVINFHIPNIHIELSDIVAYLFVNKFQMILSWKEISIIFWEVFSTKKIELINIGHYHYFHWFFFIISDFLRIFQIIISIFFVQKTFFVNT